MTQKGIKLKCPECGERVAHTQYGYIHNPDTDYTNSEMAEWFEMNAIAAEENGKLEAYLKEQQEYEDEAFGCAFIKLQTNGAGK